MNAFQQRIARDIAGDYGVSLIGVGATPPFTYTVGLTATSLAAEIIIIGLRHEYAGAILNDIAAALRRGETITLDVPDDRWANLPSVFKRATVPATFTEYTVQAHAFYGKQVDILQLVMPDKVGTMPWEDGYDRAYMGPRQTELWGAA